MFIQVTVANSKAKEKVYINVNKIIGFKSIESNAPEDSRPHTLIYYGAEEHVKVTEKTQTVYSKISQAIGQNYE